MAQSATPGDDSGLDLEAHVGDELCRPDMQYSLGILRDPRPYADHAQFERPDGTTIPRTERTIQTFLDSGGEWQTPNTDAKENLAEGYDG
ncbi:hypothetical protein ABSL23_15850 (plasmid) [Halobacterium sp. NMX12-1]|uniref:Uncharacterized protein n=1 Tax=Halobacterium sp. NMX12-1 TaxID=3166650 RepID=A0AAU8CHK7_9EURY